MNSDFLLSLRSLPEETVAGAVRTVGPLYWGLVLAVFFCGISVVQAHYYFRKNNDKRWLRGVAIAMLTCDIVSTGLVIGGVYNFVVPNFGNITSIWVVTPTLSMECFFASCVAAIAQFYFAYQINIIKTPGLAGRLVIQFLGVTGILSFAFGTVCFAFMFVHSTWNHWPVAVRVGATGCKIFAMLFDIVSTCAMCYYLSRGKNSIHRGLRSIIRLTFVFFLHRGALVTILQIILFVFSWTALGKMYWLTPHLLLTRLYTNTFFAMLNSRKYLNNKGFAEPHSDPLSVLDFSKSMAVSEKRLSVAPNPSTPEGAAEDGTSMTGSQTSILP